MNKKEIEKKFDERFWNTGLDVLAEPIKSFFLDEILPEVFLSVMPIEFFTSNKAYNKWEKDTITQFETLCKEKYNINL